MVRFFDRLNLTPSERRLVVIIFVVAFAVVNYWLVWPRFSEFGTISEDIASMERKRSIYEREIARKSVYEAMLVKLRNLGSVLPAGEERIQFRSDMERVAREAGLAVPRWGEVVAERSSGGNTNAFFEAISITMSQVSGTENQIVDFLYRVGASNSTIRVKELTLMPGNYDGRAQGQTNLVATIKLVASVQKAGTEPAPAPVATNTNSAAAGTRSSPGAGGGAGDLKSAGAVPRPNPGSSRPPAGAAPLRPGT